MKPRPRLATVWLGGCSGCHMSFLDLDERLAELAGRVELLASPFTDRKEFLEADITLVEGAVANSEHLEQIKLIRERTKTLISFGDCAVTGNVTAMRNAFGIQEILTACYQANTATIVGIPGSGNSLVPALLPRVQPVHEIVTVDYYLQGCPPPAGDIYALLVDLLDGREPHTEGRRFG
jgi:NAD-reducing hydrogenase small subunit